MHLCKPLKKYTILLLDYLRLSSSRQGKENLHKLQFLPVGSDIVFLTSSITTLSEYFLLFPSLDVDTQLIQYLCMYTLSECCFALQSIFNALKNMQQQLLLFVRIANINILKPLQTTFHELLSYYFVSVSKVLSNIYLQTSRYIVLCLDDYFGIITRFCFENNYTHVVSQVQSYITI